MAADSSTAIYYITNDYGESVQVDGSAYDAWLSNPYDGFAVASGTAPGGYEKISVSNEKGEDYTGNFQTVVTGTQVYNQGLEQGQQTFQSGTSYLIDDQERVDRGPGVLGLGELRLTSIDIVQDVSYPGGDDIDTTLPPATEVTPVLTDKRLDSNFTGYSDFPGNDAFGGLTVEETAALDRAIINLAAGFNEKNPFESKTSIENAARAAAQAADLLDYFGDKLTTADRADLETIINVGRQVAQVTAVVEQGVGGAIESLREISLTSEDQTPNEIARSISDRAYAVYESLTRDEKMVLRTLFPDLDKQLGLLQNITGSQNPFASMDNFRVTPYTAQSFQPLGSTEAAVDRAVAAWIAENGSISESEYARIESAVRDSRGTTLQQEGVSQDQQPRIDREIRFASATAGDDPSVQTDILNIEDLNNDPLGVADPTLVQNLLKALDTPKDVKTTVSNALADYFGIDNPLGISAIDRAVKLAINQLPGVSEINRAAGTVRTLDNAATTLSSDQLSPQDLVYTTLSVLALANPQAALLLKALDFLGLKPGPATTQSSTIVPTGGGGGAFDFIDSFSESAGFVNEDDLIVSDDDGFILSDPEDPTSLRVAPEDLFEQQGEDGLFVLREELEEVENIDPDAVDEELIPNFYPNGLPYDDDGNLMPGWAINPETGQPYYKGDDFIDPNTQALAEAARQSAITQAAADRARSQAAIESQRKQANEGDWRVKLRLAGAANYLYKDPGIDQQGILYPLSVTDGVVFPYTPKISSAYKANYSSYDLTHSNYRGYFYQNSYVDEISIDATFTAQDTNEANYLLAVIHFFRSVTKMFYGQDAQRGSPPPLVFLQGLGEFQYNLHPCVVSNFNYELPNDVDYIRARTANIDGTSLLQRRDRQTLPTNSLWSSLIRLSNASPGGLQPGALRYPPSVPTLGTASPTYVPTKIQIQLSLLPIQTRQQVSQQFSLKNFANGNLLKGGFW